MVNLNTPITTIIFSGLSKFEPYQTLEIWQTISFILYTGIILWFSYIYKTNMSLTKFIWSFSLAGFWHTIVLGQIYIFLFALIATAWISLLQNRNFWAGVAIGALIAIKPNFALWPIFLFFSGYYATFFVAALTCVAISLIPLIRFGTHIYQQWFEASALEYQTLIMPGNNSILGLTARFDQITIGIVISILTTIFLLLLSRGNNNRTAGNIERVSGLSIIASLLASPLAWTGYTIFLLPIYFSREKWGNFIIASAVILTIPFALVLQFFQNSYFYFVIFGWLYGWAIILLLWELLKKDTPLLIMLPGFFSTKFSAILQRLRKP